MGRLTRLLCALVLALSGLALTPAAPPAEAASDVVRRLEVDYAVQPDGSVRTKVTIAYHFSGSGRHGINYDLVVREPWGADATKDVVYDVSDVTVSSPTGAPSMFQRTDQGSSPQVMRLRIGDPDHTVKGNDQTYVISYTLRGALRNFEASLSEFYWDVTADGFPRVDAWQVRLSAPGGVQQPKCTTGVGECGSETKAGVQTWSGKDLPSGTTLTVAGKFATVDNSDPVLEPRQVSKPTVVKESADVVVAPDGKVKVTSRLTVLSNTDRATIFEAEVPKRRRISGQQDALYELSDVAVTTTGTPQHPAVRARTSRTDASWADTVVPIRLGADRERTYEVVLTYTVTGATRTVDGRSQLLWTPFVSSHTAERAEAKVTMPAAAIGASCLWIQPKGGPLPCTAPALSTKGTTSSFAVTWHPGNQLYALDAPSGAFAATERTERSVQGRAETVERWSLWGSGGIGALTAAGMVGWVMRPARSRRWVNLPPGVIGGPGDKIGTDRGIEAPVRFEPPSADLIITAVAIHDKPKPEHLAAVLTQLAVDGHVELQQKPTMVRRTEAPPPEDRVLRMVWDEAAAPGSKARSRQLNDMGRAVGEAWTEAMRNRPIRSEPKGRSAAWALVLGLVVAGAAIYGLLRVPGLSSDQLFWCIGLIVLGVYLGAQVANGRVPAKVRTARGTAIKDQAYGFKLYLTTAEADQLRFEEAADIHSRYLPWAVLFGVADEWTRRVRAAFPGKVLDLPATSITEWVDHSDLPRPTSSESSSGGGWDFSSSGSGGSGSSSSSSSFSSGGGGGGSSVSSW